MYLKYIVRVPFCASGRFGCGLETAWDSSVSALALVSTCLEKKDGIPVCWLTFGFRKKINRSGSKAF